MSNNTFSKDESATLNQIIRDKYLDLGPKKLAEEFSQLIGRYVMPNTVRMRAYKLGIASSRFKVIESNRENLRHDYFDTLDRFSAYDLGFIFADGCISPDIKSLAFGLCRADRSYLEGFKDRIRSNSNVLDTSYVAKSGNTILCSQFRVTSTHLVGTLYHKWGVLPRKTYIDVDFPDIEERMVPHFIRGLIDGDGSAHEIEFENKNKSTRYTVNVYGTEKLVIGAVDWICRLSGAVRPNLCCDYVTQEDNALFKASWTSPYDITKIYPFLYPPGESDLLCLGRKRTTLEMGIRGYRTNPIQASDNTTGYMGVQKASNSRLFQAVIQRPTPVGQRAIYLGRYLTKEEAAYAYNHAVLLIKGSQGRINLIPDALTSKKRSEIESLVFSRMDDWFWRYWGESLEVSSDYTSDTGI